MKSLKRILPAILAIAMLGSFTACNDEENENEGAETTVTTGADGETTTQTGDVAVTVAVPEVNLGYSDAFTDEVVMTIGDYDVSLAEYRWYFLTIRDMMDRGDATYWEGTATEGTDESGNAISLTKEEDAKNKVESLKLSTVSYLQTKYTLLTLASKNNAIMTDEDWDIVTQRIADEKKAYEADENKEYDTYEEYLKESYYTDEVLNSDLSMDIIVNKLIENLYGDKYKKEKLPEMCMVKHILLKAMDSDAQYDKIDTPDGATEEEVNEIAEKNAKLLEDALTKLKAEKLKEAEEVLAKLNEGADFDEMITKYNQDPGETQNEDGSYNGYLFGKGTMLEEFETASYALKVGEISDIVETTAGYHIITRVDINDNYVKEHLVDLILDDDEYYAEYSEIAQAEYDSLVIKYGDNYGNINIKSLK